MENKETQQWLTLADIHTVRTSNPKEMLNKFLAAPMRKEWDEDFCDEGTGEVITIHRSQTLMGKGVLIDEVRLQQVMFHIQCGDCADALVSSSKVYLDRCITGILAPFEVTFSCGMQKRIVLCRATSVEAAIQCVHNYAAIYLNCNGWLTITGAKARSYSIVEDDAEAVTSVEEDPNIHSDTEYYKVDCRFSYYDQEKEKVINEDTAIIIKANEVAVAKVRALNYMNVAYKEKRAAYADSSLIATKASPYNCFAVVPLEYCKLFKEPSTIN